MTTTKTRKMTRMTTERTDPPTVVATLIWSAPGLVLRGGVAYLRMKSRARVSADRLRASLVNSGMPPERARQLSEGYGADLSITKLLGELGIRDKS